MYKTNICTVFFKVNFSVIRKKKSYTNLIIIIHKFLNATSLEPYMDLIHIVIQKKKKMKEKCFSKILISVILLC